MEKQLSIFSSQRPDLDSEEKEKEVLERRKKRKVEELKTDIAGLPYLLSGATAVISLSMLYFSIAALLYSFPVFLTSIAASVYVKKVHAPLAKKSAWMKIPLYVFAIGLTIVVFNASVI